MEIGAYIFMGLASLAFVTVILVAAFIFVSALLSKERAAAGPLAALASLVWVFWVFLWSLGVIFWSALVLLLVDMGRKLRSIAVNTRREIE